MNLQEKYEKETGKLSEFATYTTYETFWNYTRDYVEWLEDKIMQEVRKKITCHAELCPSCDGEGEIEVSGVRYDDDGSGHVFRKEKTCNCCKGEGWIVVPNNMKEAGIW